MGPILTMNAFLPLLKKGQMKKVITLSSGLGDPELNRQSGFAAHSSYCVSKCALEMVVVKYARRCYHFFLMFLCLTIAILVALQDEGFIFLAISPGVVNTAEAPRKSINFDIFSCLIVFR